MSNIKARIRRLIDHALRRQGFEMVRLGWDPARLRKDFSIKTLIDVGVGVGDGTPVLYSAFPSADLILVEPNPQSWPFMDTILAGRKGHAAKLAAAKDTGVMMFHSYPSAPELSSFVKRDDLQYLACDEIECKLEPLDKVVQEYGCQGPFGLKIDTEGFELAVLEGAVETLKQTQFVLFESQIDPAMEPPYSQAEIFGFLAQHDFDLCDIVSVGYEHASRRLKQADLLFEKRE